MVVILRSDPRSASFRLFFLDVGFLYTVLELWYCSVFRSEIPSHHLLMPLGADSIRGGVEVSDLILKFRNLLVGIRAEANNSGISDSLLEWKKKILFFLIYFLFLLKNLKKKVVIRRDLEKIDSIAFFNANVLHLPKKKNRFFMIEKYSFK